MPIRRFLPGQAFDQDAIEAMSEAFIDACKKLGLSDVDDPMTRFVARHIIELAQRGIRAKTALYFRTLEEFRAKAAIAARGYRPGRGLCSVTPQRRPVHS
jgi:hypothetical protein